MRCLQEVTEYFVTMYVMFADVVSMSDMLSEWRKKGLWQAWEKLQYSKK